MKPVIPALLIYFLTIGLARAEDIVGFQRLSTTPAEDTKAWDDPDRFTTINLDAFVAFSGGVESASVDTVTTTGAFWRPSEFVYAEGEQPKHFQLEITSGTASGSRFDILGNNGNSVTVDLDGASLAGVSNGDGMRIVAKWSLNQLFPEGKSITASTSSSTGSEILFPTFGAGGIDFSSSAVFQYRSDLDRWIDRANPAVDVGDDIIPGGAQLVIRQRYDTPIRPLMVGYQSNMSPLAVTVSYQQVGLDMFSDALPISGEGSETVDTSGATGEMDEPSHAGNATTASVWFRYTATQSGTLIVRSENSDFDTILAAYSGTAPGALTLLAENDDSGVESWSEISFSITSGQDYMIALDGKNGATGSGSLIWNLQAGFPEITVEQPENTTLVDGSSSIDFGEVFTGMSSEVTFTIRNEGVAPLSNLTTTVSGTNSANFTPSALAASVLAPGDNTTFTVSFEPSGEGALSATLQIGSNDSDENPFDVSLTGVSVPVTTLDSWASDFGLSGNSLLPGADDDGDGVSLIEEYAYNLDPTVSDSQLLTPGSGTSGLPSIRLVGGRLQVEFLRRLQDAGMTTSALFSGTLPDRFQISSETESVTAINSDFERVVVTDSETTSSAVRRFAKVVIETAE